MIGQIEDLQKSVLYRELERRVPQDPLARQYRGCLESSWESLHQYLDDSRRFFFHFTDHCITHSIRIINRIGAILAPIQLAELSTAEVYMLMAVALVHDIGMVVSEAEATAEWAKGDLAKKYAKLLASKGINLDKNVPADWYTAGVGRLLVADHMRGAHGKRAKYVLQSNILPIELLTGGRADRKKHLGQIAEAHTLSFDDVIDEKQLPSGALIDECRLNTRFIAICLRLGDLLDINSNRICPVIRHLSEPLNYVSKAHWDQYLAIELHEVRYASDITVSGTCPSQDAHRLLKEWLRELQKELNNATGVLNPASFRDPQYCLRLGRVRDEVEPQRLPNGLPAYELLEYRFNLDEERVFEKLFGERLYGRIDLAVRELIQNSIDATRYRVAYDLASKEGPGAADANPARRLRREIATRRDELALQIHLFRVRNDDAPSGHSTFLSIEDRGIGMARDVIKDYLLKVGRSRWREDPLVNVYKGDSIGEFGIGFLSTFMIADRIVVETCSVLPQEEAIRATIHSWRGYIATEPSDRTAVGTRITLRLKDEAQSALGDRLQSLRRWCPLLELPVDVTIYDDKPFRIPARKPNRVPQVGEDDKAYRVFFPLGKDRTGSLGSMGAAQGDYFAGDHSLCQDGLVIPDVPPPRGPDPLQLALAEAHVCVDLRGKDRFPLDLSRNLIRGNSRKVWDRLAPKVWAGIVRSGALAFTAARNALDFYANLEYSAFGADARLVIDEKGRFHPIQSPVMSNAAMIGFASPQDPQVKDQLYDNSMPWILAPEGLQIDFEYNYSRDIRRARIARKLAPNEQVLLKMVDPSDEPFSAALLPGEPKMASLFRPVFRQHSFLCSWSNGSGSYFANSKSKKSIELSDLGIIFPTPDWVIVRPASQSAWVYCQIGSISDIAISALNHKLSWNEFLLWLLYCIDSNYFSWSGWWSDTFPEFNKVADRMEQIHERALDEYDDKSDDDGYDESRKLVAWEENRREGRVGSNLRGGMLESEMKWFIDNILPGLNLKFMQKAATPWDKDRWNSGQLI